MFIKKSVLRRVMFWMTTVLLIGTVVLAVALYYALNRYQDFVVSLSGELLNSKFEQELQSSTETVASLVATNYAQPNLSDEEKLAMARQLGGSLSFSEEGYYFVYQAGTGVNMVDGGDSSVAAKEITQLISSVQLVARQSTEAMQQTALEVDRQIEQISVAIKAVNQSSAGCVQNFRQSAAGRGAWGDTPHFFLSSKNFGHTPSTELVNIMETVSAVVEENTASTQEMSASAAEVTHAVENIAAVSEENSAALQETSTSTEEMNVHVEEMVASINGLTDLARQLNTV